MDSVLFGDVDNPLPAGPLAWLVLIVALAIVSYGLLTWAWIASRLRQGVPLLPLAPRRSVPWSSVDLAVVVLGYVVFQILIGLFAAQWVAGHRSQSAEGPPAPQAASTAPGELTPVQLSAQLASNAAASLLSLAFALVYLRRRSGATWHDLGLCADTIVQDVRLGLAAFVAICLPVYSIQLALVKLWPSHHPIQELLEKRSDLRVLALSMTAAVITAPLAEEWFFRVILQGWLERAWPRAGDSQTPTAGGAEAVPGAEASSPEANIAAAGDETASATTAGEAWLNPPRSSASGELEDPATNAADPLACDAASRPTAEELVQARAEEVPAGRPIEPADVATRAGGRVVAGPIVISSLIFALPHLPNGPDPIPLFVLALGLGYLYQRTHRVLPSIVVHLALNSASLLLLWFQVTR